MGSVKRFLLGFITGAIVSTTVLFVLSPDEDEYDDEEEYDYDFDEMTGYRFL